MTRFGKAFLTKASGVEVQINSKVHAFIAAHPIIALAVAVIIGIIIGRF